MAEETDEIEQAANPNPAIRGEGGGVTGTPKERGGFPVSALRQSLLAGVEPASNPECMIHYPPDGSDLVSGTGVHTVVAAPNSGGPQIQEIGRWKRRKDAWEENTGTGRRVNLGGESGCNVGGRDTAIQDTRMGARHTQPNITLEGEATRMEPQSFQTAILRLPGPSSH